MPVILVAVALLLVCLVLLLLAPLLRYRAGTARRRARGWAAALNFTGLLVSSTLFLVAAGVTSIWVPRAFTYSALGLLAGVALGVLGLRLSRWESLPRSLHYTPNRWLVLGVTSLVTARLFYGFWRAWHAWRVGPGDGSWLAAFGIAGSMAAGAVVLGYYVAYWIGVWVRFRRHRRARNP